MLTWLRRRAAVGLAGPLLALGSLAPAVGTAAAEAPPAVDLGRIRFEGELATAPILAGGVARLTLDRTLQHAAVALLAQARPRAGAVVAVDATTGRVLAFAEQGARGPSLLLHGQAPSASVFKIVSTAALVERAHVAPSTEVCTSGGQRGIERRHLTRPRSGKLTCTPFRDALGHSRNAVYAQLVTSELARSDLALVAENLGFNRNVPFDVPVTMGTFSVPVGDLELARAATGFQDSTLSPLGALELAYVVAAGGRIPRLHIVESAGEWRAPAEAEYAGRALSAATARTLSRMMEVTIRGGTSFEAFTDPETRLPYLRRIRVAGKTGTLRPAPGAPTSSWFIGFAPTRKPEIVVSVLLQNGGVWRRKANEVARDVLRSYFAEHGHHEISDPGADP